MEINPSSLVTVPQLGKVSVGKVLCIGRNYARHAAELNNPVPSQPMVFLKPASSLTGPGSSIVLPAQSTDVHHEVELVAVIGRRMKHVGAEEGLAGVAGYAVGLDMTARDIQLKAKKAGHPWSVAKGFDTFAPLGTFGHLEDPGQVGIRLERNGKLVQEGHTSDMVFDVGTLIAWCSSIFTLEPGDLLYTGTPEGVGPVAEGDLLRATVDGLPPLEVSVIRAD